MNNELDKTTIYFWGGLVGFVIGLVSAHLYNRAVEENAIDENVVTKISTMDIMQLGLKVMGIVLENQDRIGRPNRSGPARNISVKAFEACRLDASPR